MTTAADLYRYKATVLAIHDGDTFTVDVDLGVRTHWRGSLRCAGYNAPELYGDTKAAGQAATAYVEDLAFESGGNEDHFGRLLAAVTLPDGRDLAQLMIDAGHAVADPA